MFFDYNNLNHMKKLLLGIRTESEINIGDYIQALASSQFLPSLDGFIQREHLNSYEGDEAKIILNGWFMHHPQNWPPSKKITPLFVAFHINSLAKVALLSEQSIHYLKQFQPIGCRDMQTMKMLKEKGVDAYFSGCMTLTLGYKYKSLEKDDTCYFVDPYFVTQWNIIQIIKNTFYLLFHWKDVTVIAKKYPEKKGGLRKKMILTTFYREYLKIFSRETLLNAKYINQQSADLKVSGWNDFDYLKSAEELVKNYARAKLVVTSRIHCALPCLGLETPVIYVEDLQQSEASLCRLEGLRELLTILHWDRNKLKPQFIFKDKISIHNLPGNKNNWKEIAKNLIDRVKSFV